MYAKNDSRPSSTDSWILAAEENRAAINKRVSLPKEMRIFSDGSAGASRQQDRTLQLSAFLWIIERRNNSATISGIRNRAHLLVIQQPRPVSHSDDDLIEINNTTI